MLEFLEKRSKLVSVIVLFVFGMTAVFWFIALSASFVPRPPIMIVQSDSYAVANQNLTVRVLAIDEETRKRLSGQIQIGFLGHEKVPVDNGIAHISTPNRVGPAEIELAATFGDKIIEQRIPIRIETIYLAGDRPRFKPWWKELKRPAGRDNLGPPLYPLHGRLPSNLSDSYLLLEANKLSSRQIQGRPAATFDEFKRQLKLSPDNLLVSAPFDVAPGTRFEVTIEIPVGMRVYSDLIVDGAVRGAKDLLAGPGKTVMEFSMPADVRAGGLYYVHVSDSPMSRDRGSLGFGRVSTGQADEKQWLIAFLEQSGADQDPLLDHLKRPATVWSQEISQALLSRLIPSKYRGASIGLPTAAQKDLFIKEKTAQVAQWRGPFRVFGALLCALVCIYAGIAARRQNQFHKNLACESADDSLETPKLGIGGLTAWSAILVQTIALLSSFVIFWVLDLVLGFGTF
jgi:hypothetical protein